jgi:ABC-type Na+ efflux pump permease subunit
LDISDKMLSPRNVWSVARWELMRPLKSKTTSISLITLAASLLLFQFAFPSVGFGSDITDSLGSQKLYTVGVVDEPGLAEAVHSSPKFQVLEGRAPSDFRDADLVLTSDGGTILAAGTGSIKSALALEELSTVLKEDNKGKRAAEFGRGGGITFILYPVWVRERNNTGLEGATLADAGNSSQEHGPSAQGSENGSGTQPFDLFGMNASDYGGGNSAAVQAVAPEAAGTDRQSLMAGGFTRPESIEPPMPIAHLVRYFLVFVPIIFFSLYSASTILREKIKHQGTYLLVSPIRPSEIILGKALPYMAASTSMVAAIGYSQGIPLLPLLAAFFPLVMFCLGIAVVVAILSKTPHDLNVTLTFIFMMVFAYMFYPAMFKDLSNVALVSPLGALVEYLDGDISPYYFVLLLSPVALSAAVIWVAAAMLFHDEALFSQDKTVYKLYRAYDVFLDGRIQPFGLWGGMVLSGAVLIPLVYLVELYLVFLLLPFGGRFIYLLVPLAALAEELSKVLGIAAFTKAGRIRGGALYGAIAGFGFFAGERVLFVGSLGELFISSGGQFLLIASLLVTAFVHVLCSSITGRGLQKSGGRLDWRFAGYLAFAVIIHSAYNLAIIGGALHV